MYYISLLASTKRGKHLNKYFTFDEASKLNLKDTDVIVLDVHNLRARYWQRHPEIIEKGLKGVDVYEISLDWIDSDPMGSFSFNESPFIGSNRKWYEPNYGTKIK